MRPRGRQRRTIHLVSLGCPKNRVDSEVMLGVARLLGYRHTEHAAEADVIVVNTCGFIAPAERESIDTILALGELKRTGRCRKLVVAGCLSQRHPVELARELPEVDHLLGSSDMLRLRDVLAGGADRVLVGNPADWLIGAEDPRVLSSHPGSAYVKLAEGCDRRCSFCVIPRLRGKQRSRPLGDVVREVEQLVARGVKEVNLVSQDTIAYGRDRSDRSPPDLATLVERVADVPAVRWVRVLYLYPDRLGDPLVRLLAEHPRVLPYVDMPLQHADDGMLRRMRRGHGGARLRRLVDNLRRRVPDLTFRSAFIVGHPGETAQAFDELCAFVAWAELEHVGVLRYSDEPGTRSHGLGDKVPPLTAANRYRKLMGLCRRIARRKNRALCGRRLEVLLEGTSDEHDAVSMGRHRGQAPEVDGQVYLTGTEQLAAPPRAGELVMVRITQSSDYDLVGQIEEPLEAAPAGRRVALPVLGGGNRWLAAGRGRQPG